MRLVSVFIFSIVLIITVLLLVALLLPSKITISKSVVINASEQKINPHVTDFYKWKEWFPVMQNEKVHLITNGPSEITLKDDLGKQISLKLLPSTIDTINVEVKSVSSTKVYYQFLLLPQKEGNTQLTLNVNTFFKWYPWEKLKGIMLDKTSGPQYDAALNNLKIAVEK